MNTAKPQDTEDPGDPIRDAVRRQSGIAALRQLRRMVDAEQASEEADRHFVRRFLVAFGVVALCVLSGWLLFRSGIW